MYFLAQYAVLNYVRKFSHFKPLWFANVANNILWWTFVKACWRAVGSTMGKGITFKTTIKGRGLLIANSIGDLWMPTCCLLALLASLGEDYRFHLQSSLLHACKVLALLEAAPFLVHEMHFLCW